MTKFKDYLDSSHEVGYVEKIFQILVYVSGIPNVQPSELVLFESGQTGQVLSLSEEYAEVILFSDSQVSIGTKVARTKRQITVPVGQHLLGTTTNPLGSKLGKSFNLQDTVGKDIEMRFISPRPQGIRGRKNISNPFETGVALVDLVVSLGKGQRELVVGDRKTGKTPFLLQCAYSAVSRGSVCIYAAIAKKQTDIKAIEEFFVEKGIRDKTVLVASGASDPSSIVYLTPYTAMTIAEYYRDQGQDVLIILDDMTAHAKHYREITLIAKRFPGRSSYPGDIFFVHARLMERAGNFVVTLKNSKGRTERKEVSITCLPVAELVMSDLSGYIQTNLMAMTDGHLFFDIDLFNEGRRPAVNPFLSVTRVGRQAQTQLLRDLSRQLTSFLVRARELEQFAHFGSELTEKSRREIERGDQLKTFFNQSSGHIIPLNINIYLFSLIWSGKWQGKDEDFLKQKLSELIKRYLKNEAFRKTIDTEIGRFNKFADLLDHLKAQEKTGS